MPRQKLTSDQLVRLATVEFRRRGYAATTLAHLAAATGLTKGAFYHHFRDKAHVMEAALEATLDFARERVFAVVGDAGRPLAARADCMVDGARRLFRDPQQGCFIANTALAGGEDGEQFRPLLVAFMDAWRAALTQLARDGGHADPEAFAVHTIGDVEGAIVLMRVYGDGAYLEVALARFREHFPAA